MKNKCGFTLIEMLGTIILIGILGTIAVAGVTKYLGKSREEAYDLLKNTVYEAVSNCAAESNCILFNDVTFSVEELKQKGYIDSFKNPKDNSKECNGKVTVKVKKSEGTGDITKYNTNECENSECINGNNRVEIDEAYDKYLYKVEVECDGFTKNKTKYYPNGIEEKDWEE